MTLVRRATIVADKSEVTITDDQDPNDLLELKVTPANSSPAAARVSLNALQKVVHSIKNEGADGIFKEEPLLAPSRHIYFDPLYTSRDYTKDTSDEGPCGDETRVSVSEERAREAERKLFTANVKIRRQTKENDSTSEQLRRVKAELQHEKVKQHQVVNAVMRDKDRWKENCSITERVMKAENKRLEDDLRESRRKLEEIQYLRDTERNLYNAEKEIRRLKGQ